MFFADRFRESVPDGGILGGEAAVLWKQPGQCWQLVSQLDIATFGHLCGGGVVFASVGCLLVVA